MQKRVNINSAEPLALKAMTGLEIYLSQVSISKTTKELIKIRASQINGCAYCIDMHTKDALKNGETHQRIFLLNAWREISGIFTDEEKTVLAITEEVTLIHQNGLSDEIYEKALQFFSENQIAEIVMAVITINAWNRIAIIGHFQPGQGFA
ncbi:carboxymuconolactone decarboxylase family protein [Sphingobacterium phlebotomi]|uniref:Carboxymuconolactone decarboxylase family protein n=1 Tax=Sphingobacterium phlebotomi TaxID=2605433 RepID=A0A5D4GTG3_9SPHI|nr:carboxymuconolactone decarboxylase family protein [Sphingobacterium phlebotomi]TYR32161.1 carboxymuconolactone decarboxylase family protein [Sphingobacterium phlebotomi]